MVAKILFVAANLVLVTLVLMFFSQPLRSAREEAQWLERRYAAETTHLAAYEANKQAIDEIMAVRRILSVAEKLPALAYVLQMDNDPRLQNLDISEPFVSFDNGVRIYETRISAEFAGTMEIDPALGEYAGMCPRFSLCAVRTFLYDMEEMGGQIRSFSVDFENLRLGVDFSLFGDE